MIEFYSLANPSRKLYTFLFKGDADNDMPEAMAFIFAWVAKNGWTVKKEKIRPIPQAGLFEVKVWLF